MVAFLSPVLLALVALTAAALVLLSRFRRVPRVVPAVSAGSRSAGRRLLVAGTPTEGAIERLAAPGQRTLAVGCPFGPTAVGRLGLADAVAFAQASPGGLLVVRLDALGGRLVLEPDVALLRRLDRMLDGASCDVVAVSSAPLSSLSIAGTWPWSLRQPDLSVLDRDGPRLRQLLDGTPSRAALQAAARLQAVLAALVVIGLAATALAPAWLGQASALIGAPEGNMPEVVWLARQVADQVRSGGDLFHSDALFWPSGSSLLRHTAGPLVPYAAAPFVAHDLLGWNAFVGCLLALAGWFTWRLGRRMDLSSAAALVASAVVVLGPASLVQLGEAHSGLLGLFVLPLAVERVLVAVDSPRASGSWIAAGALLLALLFSWLLGAIALGVAVVLAVDRTVRDPRPRRVLIQRMARLVALAVPAAVPLIAQAVAGDLLALSWDAWPHELAGDARGSLVVDALVRSSWRPAATAGALLGAVAFLGGLAARPALARPIAVAVAGLLVLAIGPWFAPVEGWSMAYTLAPGAVAHGWLPLASLLQHPAHLVAPAALGLGLLGAFALDRVVASEAGRFALGAGAVLVASLGAFPVATTPLDSGTRDVLALLPECGTVAYLPVGMEGPHLLAFAAEGRSLVGGPGARAATLEGGGLWARMMRDPGLAVLLDGRHAPPPPEAWGPLAEKGLRYVIVDNELIHALDAVGAPEADAASGLPLLIQASLGPPLISGRTLTVYRLRSP